MSHLQTHHWKMSCLPIFKIFKKNFGGPLIPLFWASDDVSKPEWVLPYSSLAEAYMLHYTFPEIHLWCDTCRPLGGQHGSWAVSSTYLQGIGGTRNWELSCHRSQCEIRQTLYWLSSPGSAANLKVGRWDIFQWRVRHFLFPVFHFFGLIW